MDRYFRYNNYFDGCIPRLFFGCKIFNKDDELIGIRFVDINQPVYVDIPIDNLYPGLSLEFINQDLKKRTNFPPNNPSTLEFLFFRQSSITLYFNNYYATAPVWLNDDFSFIGNPPEDITSFYMPKCVLRYKDIDFARSGKYKLLCAMNIIHNEEFERTFKPFHLKHLNFINRDVVVVYMETRLANEFLIGEAFEKRIVDYCNKTGYKRNQFNLTFDTKKGLLVLTVHSVDVGFSSYCGPDIKEEGFFNSGSKYKYGFSCKKNKFFLIPDGGHDVFKHKYNTSILNELSDEAKLFIEKCSKYNTSYTYHFVNGSQDKIYMYIGIAPNMNDSFLEDISDKIDKCVKSHEMELLQYIMANEDCDYDVDFLCKNGKLVCKMTKEYDADIYLFGLQKSQEVIDKISTAYKKYFKGMDTEAKYVRKKFFALSLSVEL